MDDLSALDGLSDGFIGGPRTAFGYSGDAYDASQTGVAPTGGLLVIRAEGVVGISSCWPFAVTVAHGELHSVLPTVTRETLAEWGCSIEQLRTAVAVADELGLPVEEWAAAMVESTDCAEATMHEGREFPDRNAVSAFDRVERWAVTRYHRQARRWFATQHMANWHYSYYVSDTTREGAITRLEAQS